MCIQRCYFSVLLMSNNVLKKTVRPWMICVVVSISACTLQEPRYVFRISWSTRRRQIAASKWCLESCNKTEKYICESCTLYIIKTKISWLNIFMVEKATKNKYTKVLIMSTVSWRQMVSSSIWTFISNNFFCKCYIKCINISGLY